MSLVRYSGVLPHFENGASTLMWLGRQRSNLSPFYPLGPPMRRQRGKGAAPERDLIGNAVYHASFDRQRGAGLGGFFKNAFTALKPVLKRGMHELALEGLRTGSDVLQDMKDEPTADVKKIARRRLSEAGTRLKNKIPAIVTGSGKKRKRVSVENNSKKKKKRVVAVGALSFPACGGTDKAASAVVRAVGKPKQVGEGKKRRKPRQRKYPPNILTDPAQHEEIKGE